MAALLRRKAFCALHKNLKTGKELLFIFVLQPTAPKNYCIKKLHSFVEWSFEIFICKDWIKLKQFRFLLLPSNCTQTIMLVQIQRLK